MTILRSLFQLALVYAAALLLGFLLYLALVALPLLGSVPVLFYRGLAIAGACALLLGLVLSISARWLRTLDLSTIIGAVALSLAFNICFLIIFPVTFDSSVTMFLLARIEQRDGQLTSAVLEQRFVADYLGTLRQIDRRIAEQRLSGNIRVAAGGRLALTPQGHRLMTSARMIGGWFDADPRFITPAAEIQTAH